MRLISWMPKITRFDNNDSTRIYVGNIEDNLAKNLIVGLYKGRWSNGGSVGFRLGGEDREVAIHLQLWGIGSIHLSVQKMSNRSEYNALEYGVTQIEDTVMIDWHRVGGLDSNPTLFLKPLDFFFGEKIYTKEITESRTVDINYPGGSHSTHLTLEKIVVTRPSLPFWGQTVMMCSADFGDVGVPCPSKRYVGDCLYSQCMRCEGMDDAISKIESNLANNPFQSHNDK